MYSVFIWNSSLPTWPTWTKFSIRLSSGSVLAHSHTYFPYNSMCNPNSLFDFALDIKPKINESGVYLLLAAM